MQKRSARAKRVAPRKRTIATIPPTFADAVDVTYQAVCKSGDFTGQKRSNREDAVNDALSHQQSSPGHQGRIIAEQG